MSKKNTFKFWITKAKPYIRKVYARNPQMKFEFEAPPGKVKFDINATIPKDTGKRAWAHIKKHKTSYEIGGAFSASYAGARLGRGKQKRRKRK